MMVYPPADGHPSKCQPGSAWLGIALATCWSHVRRPNHYTAVAAATAAAGCSVPVCTVFVCTFHETEHHLFYQCFTFLPAHVSKFL